MDFVIDQPAERPPSTLKAWLHIDEDGLNLAVERNGNVCDIVCVTYEGNLKLYALPRDTFDALGLNCVKDRKSRHDHINTEKE